MRKLILCLLSAGLAGSCLALDDTPANRSAEAERYIQVVPPREMFAEMAVTMAQAMPESQRGEFIELMTKNLDMEAVTDGMKESLVKVFTAEELRALADFYSSPAGKSAMKKMTPYMHDLMPLIQAEIQKAVAKTKGAPGKN